MIDQIRPFNGFDYVSQSNPTIDVNPDMVGRTWANMSTGEVFVCTDATLNANTWIGQLGSLVLLLKTNVHNVFGDNSTLATYNFDGDTVDLSGNYSAVPDAATFVPGRFGDCFSISGPNYAETPSFNRVLGKVPISFCWWAKPVSSGVDGSSGVIFSAATDSGQSSSRFSIGTNLVRVTINVYQGTSLEGYYDFSYGDWHFITVTSDSNGRSIYIDGEYIIGDVVTTLNDSVDEYSGAYMIGNSHYSVYHALDNGNYNLDQFRIFNRALTSDEVSFLYTRGG